LGQSKNTSSVIVVAFWPLFGLFERQDLRAIRTREAFQETAGSEVIRDLQWQSLELIKQMIGTGH
jgi:hypothetical protein